MRRLRGSLGVLWVVGVVVALGGLGCGTTPPPLPSPPTPTATATPRAAPTAAATLEGALVPTAAATATTGTSTPTATTAMATPTATAEPEVATLAPELGEAPAPSPSPTAASAGETATAAVVAPTATATATPTPELPEGIVEVGGASFFVEVADVDWAIRKGLGDRDSLGQFRGMWFDLGGAREAVFWMKGMRFPLDIVWVTEDLVVAGVAADAPPPAAGASDAELPLYSSGVPVRYVLEINGGLASLLGVSAGERVTFRPL